MTDSEKLHFSYSFKYWFAVLYVGVTTVVEGKGALNLKVNPAVGALLL